MKKLSNYYKACMICAALLGVLVISQVLFVLMPVYGVVGEDAARADAILADAERKANILNGLMFILVVVMIVSALLGAIKNSRKSKASQRKAQ